MYHLLNKDNPLMHQHVIHVGRHELIRQHFNYHALKNQPLPMWYNRRVISINDNLQEEMQMRDILPADALFIRCQDDDSMTEAQAFLIWREVYNWPHANYVVHCYLGVSRSAAVAKWIAETLNIYDVELESYQGFNQHIYDLLRSMGDPEIRMRAELSVIGSQS